MNNLKNTEKTYGFLWKRHDTVSCPEKWHFDAMQEVIDESILSGSIGIDVGSGCGYDTCIMAKKNPSIKIVSVDLSDGVYETKKLTQGLENVYIIKCSILEAPLKDNSFDFAYSFGVLHHTDGPEKSISEIFRILKKGCPVYLYLYEDHSGNPVKYFCVKLITILRRITIKMPNRVIYTLSCVCSPFIFIFFSIPAKILSIFNATRELAGKIPFNFGTGPFSLRGDLYDRFSTPMEYRYSRQEIYDLLVKGGFSDINITKLKDSAGWVAWGHKNYAQSLY